MEDITRKWGSEDDGTDRVSYLPDEMIIRIFENLSLESLLECNNVCWRWRRLVREPILWKNLAIKSNLVAQKVCSRSDPSYYLFRFCGRFVSNLELERLDKISLCDLELILKSCPYVNSLKIKFCNFNKKSVADSLLLNLWYLKSLELRQVKLSNPRKHDYVEIKFRNLYSLQILKLMDIELHHSSINQLAKISGLNEICFVSTNLEIDVINSVILNNRDTLIKCNLLQDDTLGNVDRVSVCLDTLSTFLHLRELELGNCVYLFDDELQVLTKLNKLEHLKLIDNSYFSEAGLMELFSDPCWAKLKTLFVVDIKEITYLVFNIIKYNCKNLDKYLIQVFDKRDKTVQQTELMNFFEVDERI